MAPQGSVLSRSSATPSPLALQQIGEVLGRSGERVGNGARSRGP